MKNSDLKEGFLVFVFDTTSASMAADRKAKDLGIRYQTIPTPTEISSGCGIALMIREETEDRVRSLWESLETPARLYFQSEEKTGGARETSLLKERK